MKRAAQALAVLFVAALAGLGSISLVEQVKENSESAELADAAPRALEKACQNLNKAITDSQDPAALAPSLFLVEQIREDMTAAENRKYERLTKDAGQAGVHKARCKQLVERAFP